MKGALFVSFLFVFVSTCACGPAIDHDVSVNAVLALDGADCSPSDDVRESGVLDIAALDSQYVALLRFTAETRIDGDIVDARFFPERTRAFVTADVPLTLATTPRSDEVAPEVILVSTAGPALEDVIFVPLISRETAASLAREPAVTDALREPNARARVNAHVALRGTPFLEAGSTPARNQLFDDDDDRFGRPPAPAAGRLEPSESPFFVFPIDICMGCLVPRCSGGEVPVSLNCFLAQDEPSACVAVP